MNRIPLKIYLKPILMVFILGSFYEGFCQEKEQIFLDENQIEIDQHEFERRALGNEFYLKAVVKNDTAVFNKLRRIQYFGKLSSKRYQLNKFMYQRYGLDTTKVCFIRYLDTFPTPRITPETGYIVKDSIGNDVFMTENQYRYKRDEGFIRVYRRRNPQKHRHVLSKKDFLDYYKKELKQISKVGNSTSSYFYKNLIKDTDSEIREVWKQDENNMIRNIFTDGSKTYSTIIIHPNGDFYMNSYGYPFRMVRHLLKPKRFAKEKKAWENWYLRILAGEKE